MDSLGRRTAQEAWRGTQRLGRVDSAWGGGDRLLSVWDEAGHRADYAWEPLAARVRQGTFRQAGTVRLTTIRGFDAWNRLTHVQSGVASELVSGLSWTYDEREPRVAARSAGKQAVLRRLVLGSPPRKGLVVSGRACSSPRQAQGALRMRLFFQHMGAAWPG